MAGLLWSSVAPAQSEPLDPVIEEVCAVLGCGDFCPPQHELPASGQTTSYRADKNDGVSGAVAVRDDGSVEAGPRLSYADNGDGTVTDLNTGLIWEKKGDGGGLHDKDNVYVWSGDGSQETIWDWLDDVNAEGGSGFAGHNDWRVPNVKELQSIVNYERIDGVSPAFKSNCTSGCSNVTCSCIGLADYWSGTTRATAPTWAFVVHFEDQGIVLPDPKTNNTHSVRAVRGGSP